MEPMEPMVAPIQGLVEVMRLPSGPVEAVARTPRISVQCYPIPVSTLERSFGIEEYYAEHNRIKEDLLYLSRVLIIG